jgi:hypothetical protein
VFFVFFLDANITCKEAKSEIKGDARAKQQREKEREQERTEGRKRNESEKQSTARCALRRKLFASSPASFVSIAS